MSSFKLFPGENSHIRNMRKIILAWGFQEKVLHFISIFQRWEWHDIVNWTLQYNYHLESPALLSQHNSKTYWHKSQDTQLSTESAIESVFRRIHSSLYLWSSLMLLCNVIITELATFLGGFWLVPTISGCEVFLKSLLELKQTMTTVQLGTLKHTSPMIMWQSSYLAVCFIFQH